MFMYTNKNTTLTVIVWDSARIRISLATITNTGNTVASARLGTDATDQLILDLLGAQRTIPDCEDNHVDVSHSEEGATMSIGRNEIFIPAYHLEDVVSGILKEFCSRPVIK